MLTKLGSADIRGRMLRRPCSDAAATIVESSSWRRPMHLEVNCKSQLRIWTGLSGTPVFRRYAQLLTANASFAPDSQSDSPPVLSPDSTALNTTSTISNAAAGGKTRRSGTGKRSASSSTGSTGAGNQRVRGSPPAAVSQAAQAAADALFGDPGQGPLQAPRIGPVRVAELGGNRGRGLVTTRTVQPGELLLAVRPLALAWDKQGDWSGGEAAAASTDLDMDPADVKFLELQRQLLGRRYTPREAAWLSSLAGLSLPDGGGSGTVGGHSLPPPPELESRSTETGGEATGELPLPVRLRDPDTLADLVQANCIEPDGGNEDEYVFWARREAAVAAEAEAEASSSDATVSTTSSAAEGKRRRGPMGLWPEAAMLNHSCFPNTAAYVVRDTLFVRAVRKVGGGSELTVSYLPVGGGYEGETGDGSDDSEDTNDADDEVAATLLSPVAVRRSALEELRGFVCQCSRCTAEEALDPKLRMLMADISEGVTALRRDLQTALALADLDEDEEEDLEDVQGEAEEEQWRRRRGSAAGTSTSGPPQAGEQPRRQPGREPRSESLTGEEQRGSGKRPSAQQQQQEKGVAAEEGTDFEEGEAEEEGEDAEEGRGQQFIGSVVDRAGLYLELMDAAMVKLRLTPAQQIAAQSAVAPLYTVLWAAMGARGELEPRLAEVMATLVGEVAPGSADHLWWAAVARETAEMIVAEEEALEEANVMRRGGGGGGGGGGGFSRAQDERVTFADKACYKAFGIRYGPLSRGVYRRLLAGRREREDSQLE